MEESPRPTVTIKLKPYLKEYLVGKLEHADREHTEELIWAILKPFIERVPKHTAPKIERGPEFLELEVPFNRFVEIRGNIYISERNQQHVNRIIRMHFKDAFYAFCDDKVRYTDQITNVILQFCSDNHVTFDDITFEMLKKAYYRRRKKIEKSLQHFSPKCPRNVPEKTDKGSRFQEKPRFSFLNLCNPMVFLL